MNGFERNPNILALCGYIEFNLPLGLELDPIGDEYVYLLDESTTLFDQYVVKYFDNKLIGYTELFIYDRDNILIFWVKINKNGFLIVKREPTLKQYFDLQLKSLYPLQLEL